MAFRRVGARATRRTELCSDYSDLRLCAKIGSSVGVKSHQVYKSYGSLKTLFILMLNCNNYCDTSPNKFNSCIKSSNGVSNSRHFLGLEFILYITSTSSLFLILAKSVFFGKNSLSRPLLFSLVPLCQALYGSAE